MCVLDIAFLTPLTIDPTGIAHVPQNRHCAEHNCYFFIIRFTLTLNTDRK